MPSTRAPTPALPPTVRTANEALIPSLAEAQRKPREERTPLDWYVVKWGGGGLLWPKEFAAVLNWYADNRDRLRTEATAAYLNEERAAGL